MVRGRAALLLHAALGGALLVPPRTAAAQDSSGTIATEFWPELEVYYQVNPRLRLYGLTSFQFGNDPAVPDNAQYGLNVDLFAKDRWPKLPPTPLSALSFDRTQPLMLRVGYRYATDIGTPDPSVQDRLLIELSGRGSRGAVTVSDRNGFDMRWIDGAYSTRYRNRVRAEVVMNLHRYQPVPYANAEWFYAIQSGEWTRVRYEVGVHFPLWTTFALEPYVGWDVNWAGPPDARGVGVNLVLSW